jgi:hypothetical protein
VHALLGAGNANFHDGLQQQTHLARFYPQLELWQLPKEVTTEQHLYEAEPAIK